MDRMLSRMAHQIIEQDELNPAASNFCLLGIHTRGVFLAKRLAAKIKQFTEINLPCGSLDISTYRDDIPLPERENITTGNTVIPEESLANKTVIIVDDVLYSGRTIRAALEGINQYGRPNKIQLAVLVDRGHRELPIRADFVGKNIPTSKQESIKVHIKEVDEVDQIVIGKCF